MNPAEQHIFEKPEPFRSMLMHLRSVIELSFPDTNLQFKWKIPCIYVGKKPLCYLNHTKNYVDVGIWHASYITKHLDKLVSKDRKVIKSLRYYALAEIDDTILIEVLTEAYNAKEKSFYKK